MKDAAAAAARAAMNRVLPPQLFSGLLAIAADAVIAVDDEQRIIFFNEGAERIFGWSAAEVGGEYLEVLLPARFRHAHRGHVHGFGEAHGRARLMGERQQISGLRKSGEEFPAEAAIERIEIDGRNVYAAVLRDISARQRAEDLLHQAIEARDDMMGIVSHDLRNPANAVKMLARSIVEGESGREIPADVRERVEVIRQAAEQMDALIQDLLDITRLEAGRLVVSPRDVELSALIARSVEALRPLADAGGITLSTALPTLPKLRVDPDRVTQILSNVIGNAIKFTSAGGSVALSARVIDHVVEITVADTGEGIPAAQLPRVFDRFFQASLTARAPRHGAGLGLPIARGIVEAHGGRIWVESSPGAGTTVFFTLPLQTEESTTPG
ncbi:MAG TPA: PAS domain-containing sensor histidine kinase [Gemmatimonadaceae bacterium]|nr:PAS domain-containing sensor histidine kinase [Gemmatimonadaceae bacterium]